MAFTYENQTSTLSQDYMYFVKEHIETNYTVRHLDKETYNPVELCCNRMIDIMIRNITLPFQ